MKKQNRRLLIALIIALLVILALVLVAGVCFSGILWLNEQNESLRQQLYSLEGLLSFSCLFTCNYGIYYKRRRTL